MHIREVLPKKIQVDQKRTEKSGENSFAGIYLGKAKLQSNEPKIRFQEPQNKTCQEKSKLKKSVDEGSGVKKSKLKKLETEKPDLDKPQVKETEQVKSEELNEEEVSAVVTEILAEIEDVESSKGLKLIESMVDPEEIQSDQTEADNIPTNMMKELPEAHQVIQAEPKDIQKPEIPKTEVEIFTEVKIDAQSEIPNEMDINKSLEAVDKMIMVAAEQGSEKDAVKNEPEQILTKIDPQMKGEPATSKNVLEDVKIVVENTPNIPKEEKQIKVEVSKPEIKSSIGDEKEDTQWVLPDFKKPEVAHLEAMTKNLTVEKPVMQQIQDGFVANIRVLKSGEVVHMRLEPENLGKLEMKLNVEKGILTAEIKVENQTVKAAVQAGIADLKQSLSQKGYDVREIEVGVKQEAEMDFGRQGFSNKGQAEQGSRNRFSSRFGGESHEQEEYYKSSDTLELENLTINYYG